MILRSSLVMIAYSSGGTLILSEIYSNTSRETWKTFFWKNDWNVKAQKKNSF